MHALMQLRWTGTGTSSDKTNEKDLVYYMRSRLFKLETGYD